MITPSNDPQQITMLYDLNDHLDDLWQSNNQVTTQMSSQGIEKAKIKFYPSVIVNCKFSTILHNGRSDKGTAAVPRSFIKYTPTHLRLRDEIQRFSKAANLFFVHPPFYCGTCAEDDAANKVLEDCDKSNTPPEHLSDLQFTKAIRPRTRQGIDYCIICEKIFG